MLALLRDPSSAGHGAARPPRRGEGHRRTNGRVSGGTGSSRRMLSRGCRLRGGSPMLPSLLRLPWHVCSVVATLAQLTLARSQPAAPSLPGHGGGVSSPPPWPTVSQIPPFSSQTAASSFLCSGCQGRGGKFIQENRRTRLFPNLEDASTTWTTGAGPGRAQRAQQQRGASSLSSAGGSPGVREQLTLCCSQPAKEQRAKSHAEQ